MGRDQGVLHAVLQQNNKRNKISRPHLVGFRLHISTNAKSNLPDRLSTWNVYTRNRNLFVTTRLADGVVSDVVARLNPTDIILNVGFHGGGIDDSEVAENIGRVFKYELEGEFSNVSLHWKIQLKTWVTVG